ncbi:MAG: cyanophycinase [Phycisphaerales bacterium]|nr:cyanophycinase [Phycisphaerales bacterium]
MGLLALPAVGVGTTAGEEMVALPRYYAIGGGLKGDNGSVLDSLLSKEGTGKVVIVPYASGDQAAAAKNAIELLSARAPKARYVVLPDPLKDNESRDLAIAWIPTADLVYFTGGDQSRITQRFFTDGRENGLHAALVSGMLEKGTPVAGTSAGAAVLCDPMFTGGGSDAALGLPGNAPEVEADDTDAEAAEPAAAPPAGASGAPEKKAAAKPIVGPRLGQGLGLVQIAMLDTHFFSRGRLGRLVAAVEKHPSKVGIGIADNRAVHIAGPNVIAMGDAACLIVDGREVKRDGLDRLNVRVTLLNDRDRMQYWPKSTSPGAVRADADVAPEFSTVMPRVERVAGALKLIPEVKTAAAASGPGGAGDTKAPAKVASTDGAWDRGVVLAMLYRLAADPTIPQIASSDKFTITISADESTRLHADEKASRVTVINARLDVREKK